MKKNRGIDFKFLLLLGTGFIFIAVYWYFKNAYYDGNLGIIRFLKGENSIVAYGFPLKYTAAWFVCCVFLILLLTILFRKVTWANKVKGLSTIFVTVFYIVIIVRTFMYYLDEKDIADVRDLIRENRYITHAGGYIETEDGNTVFYTNSKESLLNSYEKGCRLMEFDFNFTSDGVIVCAHPGTEEYAGMWSYGVMESEKPTYEEFSNWKLYGSLTPMTLDDIANFMREHKDMWLVTDVKKNKKVKAVCKYINENYPDLKDRIIVQIYADKEYNKIKKLGFKYIIFSLYKYRIDTFDYSIVEKTAKTKDLVGIAYSTERASMEEFYENMVSYNVPMYVHTVNDKDSMKKYLDMGFEGMFTDVVDSDDLY